MEEPVQDLTPRIQALPQIECHSIAGYCELRSNALAASLDPTKSYILGIDGIGPEREVFTFRVTEKASIKGAALPTDTRNSIQVTAPVAITLSGPPNAVVVHRDVLNIAAGSLYVAPNSEQIRVVNAQRQGGPAQNTIDLTLGEKLAEGRVHSLRVSSGLETDLANPRPIKAAGTIDIAGVPANPDAPKISATFSSNAAVKQKAFFDLKVDLKIKNAPQYLPSSALWKPALTLDIGFRSTKSANSIVFSVLREKNFWLCEKPNVLTSTQKQEQEPVEETDEEEPPCGRQEIVVPDPPAIDGAVITNAYAGWTRTPWMRRSHVGLHIGPKLEADRDFEKVNILGNARFDFVFHRWLGSINNKRRLILLEPAFAADKKAAAGKLQGPFFGFMLVPYISLDAGRRTYSETIKKKVTTQVDGQPVTVETSVEVPEFTIARATAGIISTFEWFTFKIPTTLTLDESFTFIGLREFAGFTNEKGAFLRSVRGFHPKFKTSLDFAIDPGRHYSFNITWEDGRTPPSFEYLNKLTTGLKVIY